MHKRTQREERWGERERVIETVSSSSLWFRQRVWFIWIHSETPVFLLAHHSGENNYSGTVTSSCSTETVEQNNMVGPLCSVLQTSLCLQWFYRSHWESTLHLQTLSIFHPILSDPRWQLTPPIRAAAAHLYPASLIACVWGPHGCACGTDTFTTKCTHNTQHRCCSLIDRIKKSDTLEIFCLYAY